MKVLALVALGLAPASLAASPALTAAAVLADVKSRGADAVRDELYNDEERWQAVIAGVRTGSPAWLEVAQRLKPLRGDVSEELTVAVSAALARSARSVLAILDAASFDSDDVCSLNTLENSLGEDYAAAVREVAAREQAVSRVADRRLSVKKRECLAFLRELKREVVRNREGWFAQ